ncbi:hypothetical protein BO85DRAFT_485907 [Aspergillus piperis CBS 112811]|uniref:GH18 domain-containing protein n=1 Tax=Aspergillus piperis CBS 112811 TaxID=1448313 RepID=A0A8G1VN18_9EURO|nr:hypothetical protein BO85DRAFT_485907 [Aspergillus piperis CBS 112811]RAH59434.1 hypothetical protein BO85DRAFT_485907 [Aspergillus piperis CBS 112811]
MSVAGNSFGYCGVTSEFCGNGCQKNSNGGVAANQIAQNALRILMPCPMIDVLDIMSCSKSIKDATRLSQSLIIEPFTHINLAFVNLGDDYKLEDEYGDIVDRVSFLKFTHPELRVDIAVGGWTFSDAPTQHLWTQMARSYENRQTSINSVVKYLKVTTLTLLTLTGSIRQHRIGAENLKTRRTL